jgi:hypothetical protein
MRDVRIQHGAFPSSRILAQRRFCCCLPKFREVLLGSLKFGTDKLYRNCRKRTTNIRCITSQKNKGLILFHCRECSTPLTMALNEEYHPKHVQQFPDINKLCNVASCWIYIGILLGTYPILHISRIKVKKNG